MAVVGTASRGVFVYSLEGEPKEFKKFDSPLKYQVFYYIYLCELPV